MVFQDVSDKPLQTKDNVPVCSTIPDGMTTGKKRINAASQEAQQERDEQPQQGREDSMNLIFENRPDVNGYLRLVPAEREQTDADSAGRKKARQLAALHPLLRAERVRSCRGHHPVRARGKTHPFAD